MGLWGLADLVNQLGYEVEIIHTGMEEEKNGYFDVNNYLDESVIMVGFSAHWFPMLKECIDLANEVKLRHPQIYTMFGGFSASYFYNIISEKYNFIDVIIRGDSEEPLRQLLYCINKQELEWKNIPNLVWRNQNGIVVTNEFAYIAQNENIEQLDFASFEQYLHNYSFVGQSNMFDIKYGELASFQIMDFKLTKTFYLFTGKGCYTNCTFCGGGIDAQRRINNRNKCLFVTPTKIIATIKGAMRLGYRNFYICFDPLPDQPKYLDYLTEIRNEKLDIDLFFSFWKLPTPEIIEEFYQTSKNLLFELSPETIVEENRDRLRGYSFSNKDMWEVIDTCYKKSIYLFIYFSYPLPYESYEDVQKTRQAYWELNTKYPHYIEALNIKISTDPGAPLYCNPEQYGCKLDVKTFEEHLNRCSNNEGGNILIHSNTDHSSSMQILYKFISYDSNIMNIFKYHIKLIAGAFYKNEDFIDFLDYFYVQFDKKSNNKGQLKDKKISEKNVIEEMCSCLEQVDYCYQEWLKDFLFYCLIQKKEEQFVVNNTKRMIAKTELKDMLFKLVNGIEIFQTEYSIVDAYRSIIIEKKFVLVEKLSEIKYYMFTLTGKVETFEINESMYHLLKLLKENDSLSINQMCFYLANEYAEIEDDIKEIQSDLILVCENLYKQNLFMEV
jgi:radical SAM superfamily enzyme YgiQ (UPF0313 family)